VRRLGLPSRDLGVVSSASGIQRLYCQFLLFEPVIRCFVGYRRSSVMFTPSAKTTASFRPCQTVAEAMALLVFLRQGSSSAFCVLFPVTLALFRSAGGYRLL
jgi:hypothetical protein